MLSFIRDLQWHFKIYIFTIFFSGLPSKDCAKAETVPSKGYTICFYTEESTLTELTWNTILCWVVLNKFPSKYFRENRFLSDTKFWGRKPGFFNCVVFKYNANHHFLNRSICFQDARQTSITSTSDWQIQKLRRLEFWVKWQRNARHSLAVILVLGAILFSKKEIGFAFYKLRIRLLGIVMTKYENSKSSMLLSNCCVLSYKRQFLPTTLSW